MARVPVNPGTVAWAGDNPGIYLRETPDGPWTGLGIFFRVLYSAYGQGSAMVILGDPGEASGFPNSRNVCLSTNQEMMRYLVDDFLKAAFGLRPTKIFESWGFVATTLHRRF